MNTICADKTISLYEQEELSLVTGGVLRPGGVALTSRAMEFCRLPAGSRILDVGCGHGQTLALLAAHFQLAPYGLDLSYSMLNSTAAAHSLFPLLQADAGTMPVRDASFAAVICECVLSLTRNRDETLKEMHRVLAPGGKLVIADIFARKGHVREEEPILPLGSCLNGAASLTTITSAVQRAGFKILLLEDHTPILKQLAGQIIFTFGSLQAFWQLFMDPDAAHRACTCLALARPGYYQLIARKKEN